MTRLNMTAAGPGVPAFILFIVVLFTGSTALAAPAYQPGEVIKYNIKQTGVTVGSASLTFAGEREIDGRKTLLVVFVSKGPAFFDTEEIYLDPGTFRPVKVLRDLKIFGGHEVIVETYESDGRITIRKDSDGKVTETVLAKKGPVDNIYGFIYRYRAEGDFSAKKTFDIRLPTVDLTMKISNDGNFNAAGKIYPAATLRSVPSKYTIWMDKSEKRLPLRIAGAVGIGNTVMTMVGVEQRTEESKVKSKKSKAE